MDVNLVIVILKICYLYELTVH